MGPQLELPGTPSPTLFANAQWASLWPPSSSISCFSWLRRAWQHETKTNKNYMIDMQVTKTNHTTTRNTREPKATLLVHCSKRMKSVVGPAVKYSCHAGWGVQSKGVVNWSPQLPKDGKTRCIQTGDFHSQNCRNSSCGGKAKLKLVPSAFHVCMYVSM